VLTNTTLGSFNPSYLDLNLGGGTDTVQLSDLSVNGNGQVLSATGSLKLDLTNALFQGYLKIGAGAVSTRISNSRFGGWLWVNTGQSTGVQVGPDCITIDSCEIGGFLRAQTTTNHQLLIVNATTVGGDVDVHGCQQGATFIATGSIFQGGMVVNYLGVIGTANPPPDGSDYIQLTQTTVKGALNITTGTGNDTIILHDDSIGQASPFAVTTINTGGGNDTVDLSGSTFYCHARFDGGPGTDTLHKGGARFLASPPILLNFETDD
jgi:hypothetical protein